MDHPAPLQNHPPRRAFHVMIKPVGPICNLGCSYCFYLDKGKYYPDTRDFRMRPELLESFVRQYIAVQDVPEITFGWQGGEPTLAGLDFFRRAVRIQKKFLPQGMRLINAFQTNGTNLSDEWCDFFKESDFLVGISLDGPRELHDRFRRDKSGMSTFEAVMRGLRLLQKHRVEYNVLCVVHRYNSLKPEDVYRFFKDEGVEFLQFIPLVERLFPPGRCIAGPPRIGKDISEATVPAGDFGRFLCSVYDEWIRSDVGRIYVQMFEAAFASRLGRAPGLCLFEKSCGRAMALEHNGDLYSCDHYVYPEYRLGNILEEPLARIVEKPFQRGFGESKHASLPGVCRKCPVLDFCRGECPKNRFITSKDGEPGLNYLCKGLKKFFLHAWPTLDWMAGAYRKGLPPSNIMRELCGFPPSTHGNSVHGAFQEGRPGRNDPCPCGSGRKFKRCCGNRQVR